MINRYPILAFVLTVLLIGYLCFAVVATNNMEAVDTFGGCRINVADSVHSGFVSELEVSQECDDIMQWIETRTRSEVNLSEIEKKLRTCDKIETANVFILNNGILQIDVVPMQPVARIFDVDISYYINAEGKRISADPRYHIDVPVVVGSFTPEYPATRLLPLLDYVAEKPELNALVSTVKQNRNGDIIIVPTIRGHVVNFGDTSVVANKFERIREFYRQVLPIRGWNTYDTISVKWGNQIVATRRNKSLGESLLAVKAEEFDEAVDSETMTSPLHNDTTKIY